ncbi:MAG: hypothetical protein MJ137_01425 [Clostridia bacterium]|nr:hypothetical protein [Clostridia bacterium]
MKKTLKRALTLILAIAMIIPAAAMAGCSGTGTTFLKIGKTEITENMFVFWLSRYKAQFVYAYGSSIKTEYGVSSIDEFWKLTSDPKTGDTYNDIFTDYIYDNAITYLVSLALFDEFGLSLSKDETAEVDKYIGELRENYAAGSKTEFNVVLQEYGINEKTLRECYLIDKKITRLQNYLFGAGGPEAITDETVEKYYKDSYVHFEQICIFINECPELSETGAYVTDKDGNVKYRTMSAAETVDARAKAQEALNLAKGNEIFADLVKKYNENKEIAAYTDGIYMCRDQILYAGEEANKIFDTVSETADDGIAFIELENSLHIIHKLPLTAGAWKKPANSDFFLFYDSATSKYISIGNYIKTPLFLEYIESKRKEMTGSIVVNDDVRARCKISSVKENYYF